MYSIEWQKKARMQLDKIADNDTRREIKNAVATLAATEYSLMSWTPFRLCPSRR